jgi:hypothetical protein
MARYEHLPIYKTAMDLTVYLEQVVRNFSRYHKYTLGSDPRQQSRELVTVIIRANSRQTYSAEDPALALAWRTVTPTSSLPS